MAEESKRYYVLIKDLNTFMHDYTLHRGRKQFCHYCLQDCLKTVLKIKVNKKLTCWKREYVRLNKNERKILSHS